MPHAPAGARPRPRTLDPAAPRRPQQARLARGGPGGGGGGGGGIQRARPRPRPAARAAAAQQGRQPP